MQKVDELNALEDRLVQIHEEQTRHRPVNVRDFERICTRLLTGDHTAANAAAKTLEDRGEAAEATAADAEAAAEDALMDGAQVASWVASFMPTSDRAKIEQAVRENEIDDLQVLLTMSESDLSEVLFDGLTANFPSPALEPDRRNPSAFVACGSRCNAKSSRVQQRRPLLLLALKRLSIGLAR